MKPRRKKQNRGIRGMGHVFQPSYRDKKTGEKKWVSTWFIKYYVHGHPHTETSGSTNRNVAERLLKKRHSDAQAGKPVGSEIERTALDDLILLVENDYKNNGRRTLNRIQAAATHLREHFGGDRKARDIDDTAASAYSAHRLEEGAAPSTVNCELAVLLRGFRLGKRKVPMIPEIKKLKVTNTRKGYFEGDQFRAVLKRLPEHLIPVVRIAYATGWRKEELLSRTWKNLDLNAGWLKLEPGESKNDEGREFPFTAEMEAVLKAQRERVRNLERETGQIIPWVFPLPSGERIGDFRKAWATACRLAGVPGRLFHDLRRTAVRNLERAGVARSAAMKLTGHKTEAVYRRYAITDSAMLQEAAIKLDTFHAAEASANVHSTQRSNGESTVKVEAISVKA